MTLRQAMMRVRSILTDAGIVNPQEARWLTEYATGRTAAQIAASGEEPLTPATEERLTDLAYRRAAGFPLQYLLRTVDFCGVTLSVDPRALIPRPETELLAQRAIAALPEQGTLLDIGTGSGAIAIAAAKVRPDVRVTATDLSVDALTLAAHNARQNGVSVSLIRADLFPETGAFDVIVSNPPYIPTAHLAGLMKEVRWHEPAMALDGGTDGLDFYRRILERAPEYLKEHGSLMLELGIGQADTVAGWMTAFEVPVIVPDDAGIRRMILARRKG